MPLGDQGLSVCYCSALHCVRPSARHWHPRRKQDDHYLCLGELRAQQEREEYTGSEHRVM